jgi:hypothetical protein
MFAGIDTNPPGSKAAAFFWSSLSPIPAWKLPDKTVTFSAVG